MRRKGEGEKGGKRRREGREEKGRERQEKKMMRPRWNNTSQKGGESECVCVCVGRTKSKTIRTTF